MTGKADKFVLDTQLFIRAFCEPAANAALREFHRSRAPFEYLSSVVEQELRAGILRQKDLRALERNVLGIYQRVGRIITPSANAWSQSGAVLSAMMRSEGLELAQVPKPFSNDILLALSCRESGCTLITENTADFARIRRHVPFRFAVPWP